MRHILGFYLCGVLLELCATGASGATNSPTNLKPVIPAYPGERTTALQIEPDVRVVINAPTVCSNAAAHWMVFYGLPNGNTIEQTIGKTMEPGDDWHYNIQHIGAQTRFLRHLLPDTCITVAYLEAAQKSWPAWRKKHGNAGIPSLLKNVAEAAGCEKAEWILNGHSGGGSLIFGYINAVEKIPDQVVRIAFLDSNYAYDHAAGHTEKLQTWLKNTNHFLCVLAYNDAVALLNGKTFVSASGGTWGRSHAMLEDMKQEISFSETQTCDLLKVTGLDGRVQLLLMENPGKKILHTVQVERNGFIQSMLSGTPLEGRQYEYFGEPAWRQFVTPVKQ